MKRGLALFDFDGTITRKDTLFEVIKFHKGGFSFYFGLMVLAPVFLLYALRAMKNDMAKEWVLRYFFHGTSFDLFQRKCDQFTQFKLPEMLRKEALDKIKDHLNQGHRVVVVSASAENWIRGWCQTLQIEWIATELMVVDGRITGRLATANCYGNEKVNRIKAFLNLEEYQPIYAYGDSEGDKPMLGLADYSFYQEF